MSTSSPTKTKKPTRDSSHRSTASVQKTEIRIHVYDLLPVSSASSSPPACPSRLSPFQHADLLELTTVQPGKVSSLLWTLGSGLLHSGVVIKDKEYAYGGHDRRGTTGVYWTRSVLHPRYVNQL